MSKCLFLRTAMTTCTSMEKFLNKLVYFINKSYLSNILNLKGAPRIQVGRNADNFLVLFLGSGFLPIARVNIRLYYFFVRFQGRQ